MEWEHEEEHERAEARKKNETGEEGGEVLLILITWSYERTTGRSAWVQPGVFLAARLRTP